MSQELIKDYIIRRNSCLSNKVITLKILEMMTKVMFIWYEYAKMT
jgi:hypothetical protein